MMTPRQYRPNTGLLQLESACTELLKLSLPQEADEYKGYLDQMRRDLENHGDETFFITDGSTTGRRALHVLALDLAWLRPGPIGGWSEQGMQAYCWRRGSRPIKKAHNSWYQRVLKQFFSGPNATSLLSLSDIYSQEKWVHWDWISQPNAASTHSRTWPGRQQRQDFGFEIGRFRPRTDPLQTPSDWKTRFETYREILRNEIANEFGTTAAKCVVLLCVYVSSGSPRQDQPPSWATSLFVVLALPGASAVVRLRRLGGMISNIYNCLNTALHKALEARREQRNLAQTISHEFKNLNQDVANLAGAAREELCNLPSSMRAKLTPLESHLNALHTTARATTSFCLGTYWLFSVKDTQSAVARADTNCYLFRHIMALGMRLLQPSKPNWRLVGIPTEARIVQVLACHFDFPSATPLADLVLKPAVAVMLFLALEPIRNIKGNSTSSVELRVQAKGNTLSLTETTFAYEPPSLTSIKSESVERLMQALSDYCPWELIHIDPLTKVRAFPSKISSEYRIVKITTITVRNIIVRIGNKEKQLERRR